MKPDLLAKRKLEAQRDWGRGEDDDETPGHTI
jgi:hypothetical protein